ncbi:MAG: uroporphyrinogen-III synthase [Cyanobacteria bacterium K_Offshore_surface_m2_239]|nr:uroporphyrinogen-III synthase [Cyanobacteria bacterium K_Offshore_surface_m2_239]
MSTASPTPLRGRTIAVTRAEGQLGAARRLFEEAGARILDLPALVVGPPDDWGPLDEALRDLDQFHWVIFSSANGVDGLQERLRRRGGDLARPPGGLRIAAVGRRTAEQLDALGVRVDFVPARFTADALIDEFPVSAWGLHLLAPRVQSGGRTLLAEAFSAAGARVVEVPAYETRCPEGLPSRAVQALQEGSLQAITFSSAKTVRHCARLLEGAFGPEWRDVLREVKVVSIGPQTSQPCMEILGRVDAEADPHDLEGLVAACGRALTGSQASG